MARGYWVVGIDVEDTERYGAYQRFVLPFLAESGGRFVVRGGQQEVVEGSFRKRTVVVEFPSYAEAQRVYQSEAYQAGMKARLEASISDFVIVEGFGE